MLAGKGREFRGTEAHPYELLLALHDIEHRKTRVRTPRTLGLVERVHRTVLDGVFRKAFREKSHEGVDALQTDLDRWLKFDDEEAPTRAAAIGDDDPWIP